MNGFLQEFQHERLKAITRRHFFGKCATGIGSVALASLLNERLFASGSALSQVNEVAPKAPHFPGKANHVIYMHMAGAPSQLDMFDYKPKVQELSGQPCPESFF